MPKAEANFCRNCGHAMERHVPPMEDRDRAVCPRCGFIDYVNPINVVGTIPVWNDEKVLLCRRNIEPRKHFWTLPAGFLEVGELSADGAIRETMEEAGARIELGRLFSVLDVPYAEQVHLYWTARLLDTDFDPGVETIECQLFRFDEIPWPDLAFLTVRRTLELYIAHGHEPRTHYGYIDWRDRKPMKMTFPSS
jgi:ADP-ribose pyrophosphatase YjhB (NUDIX family)